ncbi:MAG TPA: glycosyltransferase [Pyrinomonadaceae bacterium]|jgi:glycosyltransferase involved in cell wall biosynthesis|nr:glycosyltransferase [Pyrinomonadaceae bacterium]
MKPNVLFIIDSFEQGGSERQALQLLRQLHESGRVNVRLACLQDKGSLKAEAEKLGIGEIHEYPLTSFYDLNFLKQLRRFMRYVKENHIDIVHTHCFYTNIFGMIGAHLARVPGRLTSKGETDGFRTTMQKRVERFSFRLAHRVIANCLVVRDMLIREGVDPKRIIQHYNGLDLDRMKVRPDLTREAARAQFGLPQTGKRFMTIVANLRNPVKDHEMFLRAAARVKSAQVTDAAFVIAGEGELMPGLRELANQLGIAEDVHFIGRCDDVSTLLFASHVGVLSSKAEGFANAILEYMAVGLPVVATDVGGVREAISEGQTGFIVPGGDDAQMAARIIEVLSDDNRAREMGARGRGLVGDKFSSEHHLQNTLELYDEVLGNRQPVTGRGQIEWQLNQ